MSLETYSSRKQKHIQSYFRIVAMNLFFSRNSSKKLFRYHSLIFFLLKKMYVLSKTSFNLL